MATSGRLWAAMLTAIAVLVLAGGAAAAASERVTVAIEGDSIVEGPGSGGPHSDLADWMRWELRRLGASVGARGYIAAHTSEYTLRPDGSMWSFPWTYSPDWKLRGLGLLPPSEFGANGRMSFTTSPLATVTAKLPGDRFAVLFARSPESGTFTFTVDGKSRRVNAYSPVADGSGVAWVNAPGGRVSRVTVTGPVRFTGVIARRDVTGAGPQIEVSSVGQACACAGDPLPDSRRQALEALRPDITLIMLGTNGELKYKASRDEAIKAAYVAGLKQRAQIAREDGGRCVIIPHAPNADPPALQKEFFELARTGAKEGGCTFAPVLRGIWGGRTSHLQDLTYDDIHPTPPGYRRMSGRLARLILDLVVSG